MFRVARAIHHMSRVYVHTKLVIYYSYTPCYAVYCYEERHSTIYKQIPDTRNFSKSRKFQISETDCSFAETHLILEFLDSPKFFDFNILYWIVFDFVLLICTINNKICLQKHFFIKWFTAIENQISEKKKITHVESNSNHAGQVKIEQVDATFSMLSNFYRTLYHQRTNTVAISQFLWLINLFRNSKDTRT